MPISQSVDLDTIAATVVAGEGTAGTPSGGVVSVQGVSGGLQLPVTDDLNVAGQFRAQPVTTTATEALGGATILANRKVIMITPTAATIFWGTSSGVTALTGTPIFKNQTFSISVGPNVHIFVIGTGTSDARIVELS